jgi:hypothetical protein
VLVYSILNHGRVTHRPGLYKAWVSLQGYLLISSIKSSIGCLIRIAPDGKPSGQACIWTLDERETRNRKTGGRIACEGLESSEGEASSSNYAAPVLFVPKRDGSMRMLIDYRALYKIGTRKEYFCYHLLMTSWIIYVEQTTSSFDLTSGYHQLMFDTLDHPKTAFNTLIGKYE